MSETVIRVENLSKHYLLGKNGSSEGLRHLIHDVITVPLRRWKNRSTPSESQTGKNGASRLDRKSATDFWALKNVSFEVKQGEVVGVIGRNGAGKSTLLKILSRITEQTEGRVEITGRVASLLEVGTGFHPELTGRENIFLNGAILGMSRSEIRKKFDEIVAFAEVEKFLDTPVKRYSSGMYVRLAFAVAAHLEPEILIVDEVLAVGDAQFQKKCIGKMKDVAGQGRTVLFVSHNMPAISSFCNAAIFLESGKVISQGSVSDIVAQYLSSAFQHEARLTDRKDRQGTGALIIEEIKIETLDQALNGVAIVGKDALITITYKSVRASEVTSARMVIGIYDNHGRGITFLQNEPLNVHLPISKAGGTFECLLPNVRLSPGEYYINYQVYDGSVLIDFIEQAVTFHVEPGDFFGTGKLTYTGLGGVFVEQRWSNVLQALPTTESHG
jgi:lipopolysaccharide transport system ATP-binding protein